MVLLKTLLFFSYVLEIVPRSLALNEDFEPGYGPVPYNELLIEAIYERNLPRLERLLAHPPKDTPKPLADTDGQVLFALFKAYLRADVEETAIRYLNASRVVLQLGASALKQVPLVASDGKSLEFKGYLAFDGIITFWHTALTGSDSERNTLINKRSLVFFELLGSITQEHKQSLVGGLSGDNLIQIPILHFVLSQKFGSEVNQYFLRLHQVDAIDSRGYNLAMQLANNGKLNSLIDIVAVWDRLTVAAAFNYEHPSLRTGKLRTSVIHTAILSILEGVAEDRAFEVIDFLTSHGANPGERMGFFRSLQDLLALMGSNPSFRDQVIKLVNLATRLSESWDKISGNFQRFQEQQGLSSDRCPFKKTP